MDNEENHCRNEYHEPTTDQPRIHPEFGFEPRRNEYLVARVYAVFLADRLCAQPHQRHSDKSQECQEPAFTHSQTIRGKPCTRAPSVEANG